MSPLTAPEDVYHTLLCYVKEVKEERIEIFVFDQPYYCGNPIFNNNVFWLRRGKRRGLNSVKLARFSLISNALHIQMAIKAQNTHRQVIDSTFAKSGFNLVNGTHIQPDENSLMV